MSFKVGDKVVCINALFSPLSGEKTYTVTGVVDSGEVIQVVGHNLFWDASRFEKAAPDLETELRLCESRKEILSERIGQDREEKNSLERRIQELQQAIKERNKPKGRVGLKDPLDTEGPMYAVAGDGVIFTPTFARDKKEYRALGNLFYDKESAERAVHDRKQRVLRGEDA